MTDTSHKAEIDPVTGYETTGHEWNGIHELNTPFPRIVIWALVLAFAYSVVAWILLPAWPTGDAYTRGLLGLDQAKVAEAGLQKLTVERSTWMNRFAGGDFAALKADATLMARARPAAQRLFADNCAACHGAHATGGPGFPNLVDRDWLWSGDPAEIAATIRAGVNATPADTRVAEMPAFGRGGMLKSDEIETLVEYVHALPSGKGDAAGAKLFADNCAACHGEGGRGGLGVGAPALADGHWIYGGDRATIRATLRNGRRGVMPAWSPRLSPAEINLLALYVFELGGAAKPKGAP